MGRSKKNNLANTALLGTGAAAVGGAMAGAGGTTLTTCPPDDKSFYCQFVKGFNIFKMLLVIFGVLIVIGFIVLMFIRKK